MSQDPEEGSGDKAFVRPPLTSMDENALRQDRDRRLEALKAGLRNVELKLEAEERYQLGKPIVIRLRLLNRGAEGIDLATNDPVSKFEVIVTDQFAKPLPSTTPNVRQQAPPHLYIWGAPNKSIETGGEYEAKLNLSYRYLFKSPGVYRVQVKAKDDIYRHLKVDQYSLTIRVE